MSLPASRRRHAVTTSRLEVSKREDWCQNQARGIERFGGALLTVNHSNDAHNFGTFRANGFGCLDGGSARRRHVLDNDNFFPLEAFAGR